METKELEVRFDIWCPKCKYHKLEEHWDPCNDCLDYCSNGQSTKPTRFVAASGFEDWVPDEKDIWPEQGEPELPEPPVTNLFNENADYSSNEVTYTLKDPRQHRIRFEVDELTVGGKQTNPILQLDGRYWAGKTLYIHAINTEWGGIQGLTRYRLVVYPYSVTAGGIPQYYFTFEDGQFTFPDDGLEWDYFIVYLNIYSDKASTTPGYSYIEVSELVLSEQPVTEWVPYEQYSRALKTASRTMMKRPVRASERSKRVRRTTTEKD